MLSHDPFTTNHGSGRLLYSIRIDEDLTYKGQFSIQLTAPNLLKQTSVTNRAIFICKKIRENTFISFAVKVFIDGNQIRYIYL